MVRGRRCGDHGGILELPVAEGARFVCRRQQPEADIHSRRPLGIFTDLCSGCVDSWRHVDLHVDLGRNGCSTNRSSSGRDSVPVRTSQVQHLHRQHPAPPRDKPLHANCERHSRYTFMLQTTVCYERVSTHKSQPVARGCLCEYRESGTAAKGRFQIDVSAFRLLHMLGCSLSFWQGLCCCIAIVRTRR